MRVLLAGATGAIGVPLTEALTSAGHEVVAMTRDHHKAAQLRRAGVRTLVADVMDRDGLLAAVRPIEADAVVHQVTALSRPPVRHRDVVQTNRLRTTGTQHLIEAARAVGATRFLTQSIVFGYGYVDHGVAPLTEAEPFGDVVTGRTAPHVAAMEANEDLVRGARDLDGIALRYGLFYGANVEALRRLLRRRMVPIPADVANDLAWIHVDDAAAATTAALERGSSGAAYNIVDDQPVSWGQMITATARSLDAPTPRALPGWVLRMAAPYLAAMVLDTSMRVSNARAKAELGWRPRHRTYTDGLEAGAAA